MAVTFPALVYKGGGPYLAPGGYYDYKQVADQTAYDAALAAGWKASLSEVVTNPYGMLPDPTRTAPGTILSQDGVEYICDGVNWDALSIKDYTADTITLLDPASLPAGAVVNVSDINGNEFTIQKKDGRLAPVRYSIKLALIPSIFGSAGSAGTYATVHQVFPVPYDFDGVALVLSNLSASPLSLVAGVAVSESLAASPIIPKIGGVDYNAKAAAGTQLGWVDVTSSGSTAITIPANTEIFVTDYMPVKSIARADILDAARLLMGRVYYSNQQPSALYFDSAAEATKFSTDYFGGEYKQFLQYGTNGVGTPSNFTSTSPANEMHIKGLMLISRSRGVANFLSFGDSIDFGAGIGGDSTKNKAPDVAGWLLPEIKTVSTNDRPVGYAKGGWPGRNSTTFFAAAQTYVSAVKPTVCIFPAFTPNETLNSQIAISAALNRCKEFVGYCVSNLIVPVVRIPAPCGAPGYTESIRADIVSRVREWGVLVLDFNTPLYDGANVANAYWKDGTYSVDASPAVKTHPNAAGYALYKPYVADIVKVLSS